MLNLAGFRAHDFATEIIANDGGLVATAARDEVRVWEWHPLGTLHRLIPCRRSIFSDTISLLQPLGSLLLLYPDRRRCQRT